MDRVYLSGALQTPPKISDLTSKGYPTDGDPATGVRPTTPGAAWAHMVMEELLSVIEEAGLSPAKETLDQLKTAIPIIVPKLMRAGALSGDKLKDGSVTDVKLAKTLDIGAQGITLQVKALSTSDRMRVTPAQGELIIDTTKYELYGGDGKTPGGKLLGGGGDDTATSSMVYDIADLRKSSTSYELGDVVGCAYQSDKYLECTKAGTTSSTALETKNVAHGQVLTDGTVQWTVRTHIRKVNNAHADVSGNIVVEGGVKTVNSSGPDSHGNVTVDVGVKKINGQAPDGQGNFALFTSGTEDLQAGTSPLATGKLHFVYE